MNLIEVLHVTSWAGDGGSVGAADFTAAGQSAAAGGDCRGGDRGGGRGGGSGAGGDSEIRVDNC